MTTRSRVKKNATPPLPPSFPTRPALKFILVGNLAFLALLTTYINRPIPKWLTLILALVVVVFIVRKGMAQDSETKDGFCGPRADELAPFCTGGAAEARERAEGEFSSHVNFSPNIPVISVPMFFLTPLFAYLIFADIYTIRSSIHWVLAIIIALVSALLAWLALFLMWLAANLTPAPLPRTFAELRKEEQEANQLGPEDKNDIFIIRRITALESLHRRIETYTLESALLSALSFSSFMAVVMSERDYVDDLHRLFHATLPLEELPSALRGEFITFLSSGATYLTDNMIGLISLSLLFCATTFLGVLVARLRFNDGYRDADSLLRAAERLNEKEDQAIEANKSQKVAVYSLNINDMVDKAVELERGLSATVMYMRLSRNLGIFFFTAALTLCGLFFDPWISIVIASLFVGAILFGFIDQLARQLLRKRVFNEGKLAILLSQFKHER